MYITLKHHQLPKDILQQLLALFGHLNTWSICETSWPEIPTTTAWIQHSVWCFNSTSGIWIIRCYCCTEFVPCPLYLILQDQTLLLTLFMFFNHLNINFITFPSYPIVANVQTKTSQCTKHLLTACTLNKCTNLWSSYRINHQLNPDDQTLNSYVRCPNYLYQQ
jgi:hypothetical protein